MFFRNTDSVQSVSQRKKGPKKTPANRGFFGEMATSSAADAEL